MQEWFYSLLCIHQKLFRTKKLELLNTAQLHPQQLLTADSFVVQFQQMAPYKHTFALLADAARS